MTEHGARDAGRGMRGPGRGTQDAGRGTTTVQLIVSWSLVGVPLAWGVWQVVVKSMDLFRS